jgi:NADPH:quinone reductase-like Zn-dependent oxidoreductase
VKAVQFAEYGDPEVMQVQEVEEPHAGPGQVRIAVRAAGVNPMDWKIRGGMMAGGAALASPSIPGADAAGVVDEVGEGVEGAAEGDEVFGSAVGGAYAQYAVLTAFAQKPEGMSFEEAAGLPVPVETAVRTLDILGLDSGQTLLINGAAGGVGQAAVQFARARGAEVIGTASEANHELLESLGAKATTYGDGLPDRVRELAPDGVDVALDAAGHGAAADLVEITGDPQRVVTIADFEAPAKLGIKVTDGSEGRSWQALGQAAEMFEKGEFSLPVAQTFSLDEAPEAHRVSQDGHARGKLVLLPE